MINYENLKVGDKLIVKKDLTEDEAYGDNRFVYGMERHKGKTVTIRKMYKDSNQTFGGNKEKKMFKINECSYWWTPEMMEGNVFENEFEIEGR